MAEQAAQNGGAERRISNKRTRKRTMYDINVLVINNSFTAVNNRNESSLSLRKESCGSSRGGDV